MKNFKSIINHSLFLAGTIILITMFVIVSLNFSRDGRLFAKSETEPKPTAKAIVTQVPADTQEQENFGTIKYEREGFNIGEGDGSGSAISKKLASAKIEIINCSGSEKAAENLKAALKKLGINASVTKTVSNDKDGDSGKDAETGDTGAEDKTNETGNDDKTDETDLMEKIIEQQNEKVENSRNDLRSNKEVSPTARHTAVSTTGHAPKSTPVRTPLHTPTPEYTPVQTPGPVETPGPSDGNPAKGDLQTEKEPSQNSEQNVNEAPEKDNSDSSTVDKTLIIERSDKQLGDELKKIIKVGTIKKEIIPNYGYDVTIILGKDYVN